jgi:lysophospholipase L1-like esterase
VIRSGTNHLQGRLVKSLKFVGQIARPAHMVPLHIFQVCRVAFPVSLWIVTTLLQAGVRDAMSTLPLEMNANTASREKQKPAPRSGATVTMKGLNPFVIGGLEVETTGLRVIVHPGSCRIGDLSVAVKEKSEFQIEPAAFTPVNDEAVTLSSDPPNTWAAGTHLSGCMSRSTVLPGCLVPGSVVVRSPDGTVMEKGRDFLLDEHWAVLSRTTAGRIGAESRSLISYKVGLMRLDALEVDAAGKVSLTAGHSKKNSPLPPEATTGSMRLAHLFMPYGATSVETWQVFPIGPAFPEPDAHESTQRTALVPKTLKKLRAGNEVTIVAWGDSVTCGCDASRPELAFPERFVSLLGERFPDAKIKLVNAGIGGSNTSGRLPTFGKEVLSFHPDLVVIEFVNDMGLPLDTIKANFANAIAAIRGAGAEAVILTPHFVMPEWMGHSCSRGKDNRPGVAALRNIAATHKVALADAAARWEHLELEGIPYVTYLDSGINHPDDRGHDLFVKELLTFFPGR